MKGEFAPVTPGEMLKEEFLAEYGLSQNQLAKAIGISPNRIAEIVNNRVPPSNHFEKLRGNLAGLHSIRVNQQWRLIFRWHGERGEADGVYLDNHGYR